MAVTITIICLHNFPGENTITVHTWINNPILSHPHQPWQPLLWLLSSRLYYRVPRVTLLVGTVVTRFLILEANHCTTGNYTTTCSFRCFHYIMQTTEMALYICRFCNHKFKNVQTLPKSLISTRHMRNFLVNMPQGNTALHIASALLIYYTSSRDASKGRGCKKTLCHFI